MIVRAGRVATRPTAKPADPQHPNAYQTASFPSPTQGWIANSNLATPQSGGASTLENWFPTATGAKMRRGLVLHSTIGDGTQDVKSLFSYIVGNVAKMFAAIDGAIYDVTSEFGSFGMIDDVGRHFVDDLGNRIISFPTAPPAALVSGQHSGVWSVVQFATSGGVFLRAVNGIDTPQVYDGTSWSTTPAITGVDPTTLSNVWVSGNRMWFVQRDTLNAWYLPVSSIGGAAVEFPLGGIFTRGGSLLFGYSWSLETGGGLSQNCAFVSTEGEVAIYKGTDPGTEATWSLVGVYRVGRPLGPKAFIAAGGDIAIATDIGFVPLSQALQKDYAALSPSAISYPIETAWNQAVADRVGANWNCAVWSQNQMVVVAPPIVNNSDPEMYVANSRTGAWAKFTNWSGNCLLEFQGRFFFGSTDGRIIEANVTGLDLDSTYTATFVPLFNDCGSLGLKTTGMARAVLRSPVAVRDKISMQVDFKTSLPTPPDAGLVPVGDVWGGAVWGQSIWGGKTVINTHQQWRSAPGNGYTLAPALQVTSGSIAPLDTEIIRMDVTYQPNDVVV
jgi:hypothetical protein